MIKFRNCKSKRKKSVNFLPFFDSPDPLIIKESKHFVLKKVQTYLKLFKQLQFLNILFIDPNFASNTSFFGFSILEIINHDLKITSAMFHFQDIQVFVFLTIFNHRFTKSVTS